MRDTIVAIATATGGGVGMVRLSGPQALAVAGRVFRPMNPAKSPETMPGYTGAFGRVCFLLLRAHSVCGPAGRVPPEC